MTFSQYRRFTFFDKLEVKKNEDECPLEKLKEVQWTCYSFGKGCLVFGDNEGFIHSLNGQMELSAFRAYSIRVNHMHHMKQYNVLVTVGEDEVANNFLLKVWNLDKVDRSQQSSPMCTRIHNLMINNKMSKVTCLTVHENMNYTAIGFENGCVLLFVGDVMTGTHSHSKVIFESHQGITNLLFRSHDKQHFLFVTTETEVVSIQLLPRGEYRQVHLHNQGCLAKCATISDQSQDMQLVVARQNGIFFYQPDSMGQCLGFEGEKIMVYSFRSYLVVVSRDVEGINRSDDQQEMNMLTIYDVSNKFIAYSCPLPKIFGVFSEWGSLYIVCWNYKMYHLQEMGIQSKLDLLFKKNLYDVAIQVARQLDHGDLADIHKLYGDHLYNKGDYNEAIVQYVKTTGRLEPSYVIMKFLDPSQIHHLMTYLEHLYNKGLATDNHATLLLNCYTKLKNEEKLDVFIKASNLGFDVETTIKLCRSAGYFKQAYQLAKTNGRHDHVLKILLDDVKDHNKAIEYITNLDRNTAESYLKKCGKELMDAEPDRVTELIKKLCSVTSSDEVKSHEGRRSNAKDFVHVFVNNSAKLIEFLEFIVEDQPHSSEYLYNNLVELRLLDYLHEYDENLKEEKKQCIFDLLRKPEARYNVTHFLMVFHVNSFKEGMIFLYEKSKMYREMLLLYMDSDSYSDVIETCKRHGSNETDLWVQSLSYFAKKEDCQTHIVECLDYIEKHNLLPPLLVIQTLSRDSTCPLSVVKDYIIRCLRRDREEIEENDREMSRIQEDTDRKKAEILLAETKPVVFQNHKCSFCSHLLDLPSVHFYCKHSFHQHCLESYSENNKECPVCLPEKKKLLEKLNIQDDLSRSLNVNVKDGFSLIAEYFGKGFFATSMHQ